LRFYLLTLFPRLCQVFFETSLIGKACENGLLEGRMVDIRDFSEDKHNRVDDVPYGGGNGMVMAVGPVVRALRSIPAVTEHRRRVILPVPSGKTFCQKDAERLAGYDELVFLCGRYEGIDHRITHYVDEELSVGDYVVSGGELPSLAIIDAVSRLVPGVLGNPNSLNEESFSDDRLEYPQYTRPQEFDGYTVPEVLLSGNHQKIREWRREQQDKLTRARRYDLMINRGE